MKKPWLSLAALVAFVAATAVEATITEEHQMEPATASRYYPCYRRPGCLSIFGKVVPAGDPAIHPGLVDLLVPAVKPTIQPGLVDLLQLRLDEPMEESFLSILHRLPMASLQDHRAKRSTRKAHPASRRRGKQREGARLVCRGCYSGLTIVAAPDQEGKNGSLRWSQSESGEDSSGGI